MIAPLSRPAFSLVGCAQTDYGEGDKLGSSCMNSYSAPRARPRVVKSARDPPNPLQPFPVPFRPPASACGARFFSFFTANTSKISPFSEFEHDASSFAIGGKGLGSAAGAGDARNKAEVFCLQCTRVSSTIVNHSSKREKRHAKQKTTASRVPWPSIARSQRNCAEDRLP